MNILAKLILSVGLGLSFWGVFLMIKAQTPRKGIQESPPEQVKYSWGIRLLIIGCFLQLLGIWIN